MPTRARKVLGCLHTNLLLILLILSIILGGGLGMALRQLDPPFDKRQLMYFRFPGEILMRMLKMIIIPLIMSSLIAGLAGLQAKASGKLGLWAIIYYMTTTLMAVILGIVMVTTIKPGVGAETEGSGEMESKEIADAFLDLIRDIFPDNIVDAMIRHTKTTYIEQIDVQNVTINDTIMEQNVTWNDFSVGKAWGTDMIGIVAFSVAMGIVVSTLGEVGRPLYDFALGLAEASMKLVNVIIWYSPIGILFLIAAEIIGMDDVEAELAKLGMYIVTVLSGLSIHGLIVLPLIYLVVVRKNPYLYLYGMLQALVTALGTASSAATLPITYRCLEENNGVDKRATRFVLPVGATINMDGTALYEAVAAIYIAQTRGIVLNAAELIAISITATLASIGAASVPQAGLITLVIVLEAVGLPADDVTKILAVDWLLDRFRTMVNVEGDGIGAAVVQHMAQQTLDETAEDGQTDEPEANGEVVTSGEAIPNYYENSSYEPDVNDVVMVTPGELKINKYDNEAYETDENTFTPL